MSVAKKRVVIVGAGMSGLTAGAYLLRGGYEVLIVERSSQYGGLVASFDKEGFVFDAGPRAIGNAGILKPMLRDLGIDLPMVKSEVSTGIGDRIVHYASDSGLDDFLLSLRELFPDSLREIRFIERRIRSSVKSAKILNSVPNPFFTDVLSDTGFFFKEFLPLMPAFLSALIKTGLAGDSVERTLDSISSNASLNDMLSQHFFKGTPASFALGYFENFQDYVYPLGGTGRLPEAIADRIRSDGGSIRTDTEIVKVNASAKRLLDQRGKEYAYDALLWCADLKSLYAVLDCQGLPPGKRKSIEREGKRYADAKTGESVFSLFLAVDQAPAEFARISKGHFIYTPLKEGLGQRHRGILEKLKADFPRIPKPELLLWLKDFCRYNSYEISIPVLRDPSLAPAGKTGVAVSMLFDGELFAMASQAGYADEFKEEAKKCVLESLEASVYPGLRGKLVFTETATPLTLIKRFNSSNGAITGWSMEGPLPVPHSLPRVSAAPKTAIPGVFKAGQWSYSPAGVPVAILTGRIAAAAIQGRLRSPG